MHTTQLRQNFDVRTDSKPIRLFCLISCVAGCSVILLSLVFDGHIVGLLAAASLCGIAETRGRCGMSHIGMIAPLYPIRRGLWLRCCAAYSLCGLVTAYLVGLAIAGLGSLFNPWSSIYFLAAVSIACAALILRELDIVRFAAPQCDRQTYKEWAHTFGLVTGAGMWGAHIGLGVTTVITYGGLYCVLLLAFGLGIGIGEWIMVAFWLGRIVPHWLIPHLTNRTTDGLTIFSALEQSSTMFRSTAVCGMASILCILVAAVYLNFT